MDYENTLNLEQMTDEDVEALVRQQLDEDDAFNPDTVEIHADGGDIRVEGRVGTEAERQRVAQVLTKLGATGFENNVVVDEATRAQRAESADLADAEDAQVEAQLGEPGKATTDTAEHLLDEETEDDLYGTKDPQKAAQEGVPYTPPDRPVQEGVRGDESH